MRGCCGLWKTDKPLKKLPETEKLCKKNKKTKKLVFLPKTEKQMLKNWKPGNGNGHQNRKSQRPPHMAYMQSLETKVVNIEISKVSVNQDIYDKSQHRPLPQSLNPFLNKWALILGGQKCSFLTHSLNSFQICWILLPLSSRKQNQKSNHHKQTNKQQTCGQLSPWCSVSWQQMNNGKPSKKAIKSAHFPKTYYNLSTTAASLLHPHPWREKCLRIA